MKDRKTGARNLEEEDSLKCLNLSEPVCVLPLALCLHGNRTIEMEVKS